MIDTMLLFGATGDLAGRLLLPALASLHAVGALPAGFRIIATARQQWDDARFQRHAAHRLVQHAAGVPAASREALARAISYRYSDATDADTVAAVVREATGADGRPIVAYLALPQGLFPPTVTTLGDVGLPQGSRIVLEKPFGEELDDAIALNRLLAQVVGDAGEEAVYRVDHALGMVTVQNLIGLRFAGRLLETVWNSYSIEQIDVLWEETLALEGRASFYDKAGALKDVMQNHMLQVLCFAAMEPPESLGARDLQDRKVELLNAVRLFTREDVISRTRRARYATGTLADTGGADGRQVPDYVDEDGVDPARETETFAEVVLAIDNDRWTGTRFVLRTGKALAERRKEVVVHFRPDSGPPFRPERDEGTGVTPDVLRVGVDGPVDIVLRLNGTARASPEELTSLTLASSPVTSSLSPYGWVLLDVLNGGSRRSVRGDEAEAAWRVVTPILEGWAAGDVPMDEYPAGSGGPARLEARPSWPGSAR